MLLKYKPPKPTYEEIQKKRDNTIKIEVIKIIDKYPPQMKTSDSGNFIGKLLPTSKE